MQTPIQITFRDIEHSDAVEQRVNQKINKINRLFNNVTACRVTIEQTQKHQNQGKLYNVSIQLEVPGKLLSVNNNEDENLYKSLQKAADNMVHLLSEYNARLHGGVKVHAERLTGTIERLFEGDQFGFITDDDGTEYYFNSGNLANEKFSALKVGLTVHFHPTIGDEGPQAKRVSLPEQ